MSWWKKIHSSETFRRRRRGTVLKENLDVVVRHLGYPGWTSLQLLEEAGGERGLRTMVRKIKDPSLSR